MLDLGPIKERADFDNRWKPDMYWATLAANDRAALVAEVERLRAALAVERATCDEARRLMQGLFACVHDSMSGFEEDAAGMWCQSLDARRAAERKDCDNGR